MQRQTRSSFNIAPERNPTRSEDIELDDVNDFQPSDSDDPDDEEPASPEMHHCYTLEYAAEPFIAVVSAVRESIDDADIYPHPASTYERAVNVGEYINSVISAPIAFGSAAVVSVCGFFTGTARDAYNLAVSCSAANEQSDEEGPTCSVKIQP